MSIAWDLATGDLYRAEFATKASPTFTGTATIADGENDLNIASHDGSNGLKLGCTLVTATSTTLNSATSLSTVQTEANNASVAMSIALG